MAKKKLKLKKWQKFAAGVFCGLLLVAIAFVAVSGVTAYNNQKAYVEKYGENVISDPESNKNIAWTAVCADKEMLALYEECKVTKGTHFELGSSYNYFKYTFTTKDGTKYVCFYKLAEEVDYIVKK